MHTSRDNKNKKSKTCEALEILGAEKPFGANKPYTTKVALDTFFNRDHELARQATKERTEHPEDYE